MLQSGERERDAGTGISDLDLVYFSSFKAKGKYGKVRKNEKSLISRNFIAGF